MQPLLNLNHNQYWSFPFSRVPYNNSFLTNLHNKNTQNPQTYRFFEAFKLELHTICQRNFQFKSSGNSHPLYWFNISKCYLINFASFVGSKYHPSFMQLQATIILSNTKLFRDFSLCFLKKNTQNKTKRSMLEITWNFKSVYNISQLSFWISRISTRCRLKTRSSAPDWINLLGYWLTITITASHIEVIAIGQSIKVST